MKYPLAMQIREEDNLASVLYALAAENATTVGRSLFSIEIDRINR